ncbi:MAG: CBS domain-containing protein [Methanobacteriota archaeon]|nr:MAG: CBS domain-containing protein [Euryarchaeota archaeon]
MKRLTPIQRINDEEFIEEIKLVFLASLVGMVGGLGAIVFRLFVEYTKEIFTLLAEYSHTNNTLATILIPTLGGLLCGWVVTKYASEAKGHGVPEIIDSVNLQGGNMRYRVPFVKIIASAITIGSHGSAGSEGPIAQIGGGFGSLVGQVFDLKPEERKLMVISGTSAGIAAIFNAPLGGILFGMEIIRRDRKQISPFPLIMATFIGTTVARLVLGDQSVFEFPDLEITGLQTLMNTHNFIFLGLLMGLYSIFWIKGFYFIEDKLEKLPISPVLITGLGGFLVGLIELYFPEVDGSIGYSPINDGLSLKLTLEMFVIIALMKFLATSFSIGSGGSGGVFAPTLMQGVFLGSAFGLIVNPLVAGNIAINIFPVLGMAGLFAASTRAPLTTIIMTSEMVDDFNLFLPLLITVTTSWLTSSLLLKEDIYIYKLIRKGIVFHSQEDHLESLEVGDIMSRNLVFVTPSQSITTVLELMENTGHTGFPVIHQGKLVGVITEHDVDKAIASGKGDALVSDICTTDIVSVQSSCPVSVAAQLMAEKGINRMPVVEDIDHPEKIIGWITRSDIIRAYHKFKSSKRLKELESKEFKEIHPIIEELKSKEKSGEILTKPEVGSK